MSKTLHAGRELLAATMGGARLSERAMARLGVCVSLLLPLLLAGPASRAETDPELLHLGERALCAASHSTFARTAGHAADRALISEPGRVSPAAFNVFLVFGVRPCSGVLLSAWHVITSAYCTEHADNGTAFMGGLKYQSVQDLKLPEVTVSPVRDFHYFDDTDSDLDHDVAIVKLDKKCDSCSIMGRDHLTSATSWDTPSDAIMMGFGETFEGDYVHELRSATVTLVCGAMCSEHVSTYHLGNNALCGANTSSSMCWGDMGGAVVDRQGKLVALISYKVAKTQGLRQCTQPATHTFFMFIGYYRDWINSVIPSSES